MSMPSENLDSEPPTCPECGALLPRFRHEAMGEPKCPQCGANVSADLSSPAPPVADEGDAYELEPPVVRPKAEWYSEAGIDAPSREPSALARASAAREIDADTAQQKRQAPPSAEATGGSRIAYVPDPSPERPFVSGAFDFPFRADVWPRWLGMSLALMVAGEGVGLTLMYTGFLGRGDSQMNVIGGLIAGLPTIAVTIFALAYLTACLLAVIGDTADGCDRIQDWPAADMAEWIWTLPVPAIAMSCALVAGSLVKAATGGHWNLAAVIATLVVFPVALLSILETGSPWVPISLPVLSSCVRSWKAWLIFYAESGLVFGAWLLPAAYLWPQSPLLTAPLLAPLLVAVLLICSRLLGRLAWYTSLAAEEAEEDADDEE